MIMQINLKRNKPSFSQYCLLLVVPENLSQCEAAFEFRNKLVVYCECFIPRSSIKLESHRLLVLYICLFTTLIATLDIGY
jgi:hypothetical protein